MWRMYQLLRWLRAFPYRNDSAQGDKYSFQRSGIGENAFMLHLNQNKFLYDWRQTLHEIPMRFGYTIKGTNKGVERIQKNHHLIKLIIDGCREKGFLEPKDVNAVLKLTDKGRRFSGFFKLGFLNECLKEYGYIASFFFGIGGTAIVAFWGKIIFIIQKVILRIIS